MSVEENKKVVLTCLEKLGAGKMDEFLALMADDATWWIQGSLPFSGTITKAALASTPSSLAAKIDGLIKLTPTGMTAEGDRVALEVESLGKMKNGKVYKNTYHYLFIVRDGKIQSCKEYMDTDHARDVFLG